MVLKKTRQSTLHRHRERDKATHRDTGGASQNTSILWKERDSWKVRKSGNYTAWGEEEGKRETEAGRNKWCATLRHEFIRIPAAPGLLARLCFHIKFTAHNDIIVLLMPVFMFNSCSITSDVFTVSSCRSSPFPEQPGPRQDLQSIRPRHCRHP